VKRRHLLVATGRTLIRVRLRWTGARLGARKRRQKHEVISGAMKLRSPHPDRDRLDPLDLTVVAG
jgi:hypothetical protein